MPDDLTLKGEGVKPVRHVRGDVRAFSMGNKAILIAGQRYFVTFRDKATGVALTFVATNSSRQRSLPQVNG